MKYIGETLAIVLYAFASWRDSGLSGLVAALVIAIIVAVSMNEQKDITREQAFLDRYDLCRDFDLPIYIEAGGVIIGRRF